MIVIDEHASSTLIHWYSKVPLMPPYFDDQQIMRGDTKQLNLLFNDITRSPVELRANTAEKFFSRMFGKEQLDAAFNPLLADLKPNFITLVSQDDSFYCNAKHPARQVFDCLLNRAATWYLRDSKPNQMFFEKITQIIQLLITWNSQHAHHNHSGIATLDSALLEFYRWDDMEEKRAAMLESRLCESELNTLKMLNAECQVLDLLNNTLASRVLPISIHSEISTTLKIELQHCAFTAGIQSPFWKSWQRLLPLLGYVFNSSAIDEQKLYRDIPAMLNELERSLQTDSNHPGSYQQFVELLNQNLILAIQKQLPACGPLKALPYPEGHSSINTRVTETVLQQASSINQGDWILFLNENDRPIRCKLALKNLDTDQLLFVDRYGRKVMIKSNKDFSLCFSAGIAKPLLQTSQDEVIAKLLQALVELQNTSQPTPPTLPIEQAIPTQKNISAENSSSENSSSENSSSIRVEIPTLTKIAILQDTQVKQPLSLDEVNLRRAAARKAMAEAHALAEEKKQRTIEAEEQKQKEREKQKQKEKEVKLKAAQHAEEKQNEQLAQQQINLLNVGAWVEIQNATQELQRCKLAVIIASAGKYIFVDSLGRKIAEYQREQLVDAYVNNQLKLINNGDKFEDQLVKVIRSLRKDIS
jgi:hypothetical protein